MKIIVMCDVITVWMYRMGFHQALEISAQTPSWQRWMLLELAWKAIKHMACWMVKGYWSRQASLLVFNCSSLTNHLSPLCVPLPILLIKMILMILSRSLSFVQNHFRTMDSKFTELYTYITNYTKQASIQVNITPHSHKLWDL